jgi:hypothetical protein
VDIPINLALRSWVIGERFNNEKRVRLEERQSKQFGKYMNSHISLLSFFNGNCWEEVGDTGSGEIELGNSKAIHSSIIK